MAIPRTRSARHKFSRPYNSYLGHQLFFIFSLDLASRIVCVSVFVVSPAINFDASYSRFHSRAFIGANFGPRDFDAIPLESSFDSERAVIKKFLKFPVFFLKKMKLFRGALFWVTRRRFTRFLTSPMDSP